MNTAFFFVLNHLWQSTLVAGAAWLGCHTMLKANSAAARFAVAQLARRVVADPLARELLEQERPSRMAASRVFRFSNRRRCAMNESSRVSSACGGTGF